LVERKRKIEREREREREKAKERISSLPFPRDIRFSINVRTRLLYSIFPLHPPLRLPLFTTSSPRLEASSLIEREDERERERERKREREKGRKEKRNEKG